MTVDSAGRRDLERTGSLSGDLSEAAQDRIAGDIGIPQEMRIGKQAP
jgi:hypothetical protein